MNIVTDNKECAQIFILKEGEGERERKEEERKEIKEDIKGDSTAKERKCW